MAVTVLQNCQRGLIFMVFVDILFVFIMVTIKLVKNMIDGEEALPLGAASKYKINKTNQKTQNKQKDKNDNKEEEGEKDKDKERDAKRQIEISSAALDTKPKVASIEDSQIVKFIKKAYELQVYYLPLITIYVLNLNTGTSLAFSLVQYFFIIIAVILFNLLKLHHKCIENKVARLLLDILWLFLIFWLFVNIWSTPSALQPYVISS